MFVDCSVPLPRGVLIGRGLEAVRLKVGNQRVQLIAEERPEPLAVAEEFYRRGTDGVIGADEQASALDGLTGTRNRYAFRRDYAKYEGRNLHVMMFDLDDFKAANDTYGHAVGDFVLKSAGRFLREAFGDEYCYRYGGDEFLVIRPDMPEEAFSARMETLQTRIRGLSLDGERIPAGFSAGYVYGHAEVSGDLRLMLRHADHNLYESKERGKDRFTGSAYSRAFAEELEKRMPSVREEDAAAPF